MPSAPLREEFSKLSVQFPSPQSEDQGLRGIHLVTMQQLPHTHTQKEFDSSGYQHKLNLVMWCK